MKKKNVLIGLYSLVKMNPQNYDIGKIFIE
jgi:hypothetical protein